ncbi:MAG: hypothetical protein ACI865_000733 [Flavobacteriaceae bacterium]|jgi:hypothetical protein
MRIMTRFTSILGVILLLSPIVYGQPGRNQPNPKKEREEKIEQLKIAFITKELDLTTSEAEKFWPAYNAMSDDLKRERKGRKAKSKKLKENYEGMTEDQVRKSSEDIMDSEIKEVKLKKDHMGKIATVIGYKKTVKLLSVEQKFKRELLRKLNDRKKELNQNSGQVRPQGNGSRARQQ